MTSTFCTPMALNIHHRSIQDVFVTRVNGERGGGCLSSLCAFGADKYG